MGISHPTINTRDVAAFVPFRRGLGCGSTIPPLHVLVHRLMGRSMGLGYEHPVRPHNRSYLSMARIEYSWKTHAPPWTCIAQLSAPGRAQSISGRGLVQYHQWDMQSIFFD